MYMQSYRGAKLYLLWLAAVLLSPILLALLTNFKLLRHDIAATCVLKMPLNPNQPTNQMSHSVHHWKISSFIIFLLTGNTDSSICRFLTCCCVRERQGHITIKYAVC